MILSKKDTHHNKSAIIPSVYAECRDLIIIMLSVIMLNVVAPILVVAKRLQILTKNTSLQVLSSTKWENIIKNLNLQ